MIIGVISDTHIMNPARMLPQKVHELFQGVDMIIHAGDILIDEVIMELETICPIVHVVAGNNDDYYLRQKYGYRKIIKAGNKKIGVTHGMSRGKTYLSAYAEFAEDEVDCIIYGHSHAPHNEVINGILFFNPGSPTNRRMQPQHSVGLLQVDDSSISGEIIYF